LEINKAVCLVYKRFQLTDSIRKFSKNLRRFRELGSESKTRGDWFVRIFFASHMWWDLAVPYVTSALEANTTRRRKNRPPVGLEVRKATLVTCCVASSRLIFTHIQREETNISIQLHSHS